jgi:hypothetical protein
MSGLRYDIDKFEVRDYQLAALHRTAGVFGDCREISLLRIIEDVLQELRTSGKILALSSNEDCGLIEIPTKSQEGFKASAFEYS